VTASALHLYHSAVVTMPPCRLREEILECSYIPLLTSERPASWQRILEGHTSRVTSVAFSSDGKLIVSGSMDSTVRVWDTATGIQLHIMTDHDDEVNSVACSGDSRKLRVVSGSSDGTVRAWDATTGTHLHTMHHEQNVNSVAFSRDSQLIVSGSDDCIIRVWDATSGTLQLTITGNNQRVGSVAFSSDSMFIVSGFDDGKLRVWDSATGVQRHSINGLAEGWVDCVAVSSDGKSIFSAANKGTVRVWDANTGKPLSTTPYQEQSHTSVVVSRHGNFIASGCSQSTVQLWDAVPGNLKRAIQTGPRDWTASVAFSDDSKFLAVGFWNGTIWVSELATPMDVEKRRPLGHTNQVTAVAFSGNGLLVVSGSKDRTARVWSATTGVELSIMSGHTKPVTSVAFSGDGKLVVSGSDDCTARVWEAATGKELHTFTGHKRRVGSVAFSGDDKLVVSGSYDHTARVWDAVTGTHLYTMRGHTAWVTSVAFSSASIFIVSGSADKTIRIWDAATGTHLRTVTGHTSWGSSVAFSDDGDFIFSRPRSGNGMIRVWEASTIITPDDLSSCLPQYVEAPDSPRYDQFKLDREGWIFRLSPRNSWQRLCWLPTECRGVNLVHFGQTVCMGARSGTITILDFSRVRTL
jgi:WD40 repeat protein